MEGNMMPTNGCITQQDLSNSRLMKKAMITSMFGILSKVILRKSLVQTHLKSCNSSQIISKEPSRDALAPTLTIHHLISRKKPKTNKYKLKQNQDSVTAQHYSTTQRMMILKWQK